MYKKVLIALGALLPLVAAAQPLEDWVPIAQSSSETLLMKRKAADIFPDGTRHTVVKTAFNTPQMVSGIVFTTTLTRMIFDCAHQQAKVVHTEFLNSSGDSVYTDDAPDATFDAIQPDTGPAIAGQIVCKSK
ncbi:surface-adhesin E family protein [Pararobbsia alpina]|uniref:Surface-adhesin protein E-like domain-containing protein n=1 Tax=Pararobbsia alpina TaxID=621374 RepID=A0A6S7BF66_9BURK|nr:surface-adhesin E family protein [Pararobbsia alpina]CAB3789048.1 hypothetical protein LMG28138_02731 [Pararobbsia alpina]